MLEKRASCPGCRSQNYAALQEISYSDPDVFAFLCAYYCHVDPDAIRGHLGDGALAIAECTVCGLIYQREIPDPDFMRALYADWIIEGDELAPSSKPMALDHYTYLASEVMDLVAEQRLVVGSERRIRVLDFGMGWGAWLQMARSLGAIVYGSEISEPKIAHARSIGIPVLTPVQIGAMEFDLICTEQVFEHVPYPAELLQSLVASLAPSGYLKISVPPGHAVKATLSRWRWDDAFANQQKLMPVQPLEHINCFTSRSLDTLAGKYGLERAAVSPLRAMALSTGWHSVRSAAKNVLRPIYRFGLKRGTYAVYKRRNQGGPGDLGTR
jgi:SAM-dependent methyltransferase